MKIKVLMIDIGGWGGIAHYTYNLMQALSASGECDCALLTDRDYELDGMSGNFKAFKLRLNNQPYIPAVIRVIRTICACKPDIVHVQSMISSRKDWFFFALARCAGAKIVLTAHNVMPHEKMEQKAFFMSTALKIIFCCCRRIIAHSRYSRDKLMRLFNIPERKLRVIPHGNYLFFRNREMSALEARRGLGLEAGRKIVMQFGALREYKGIDIVLDAFARIRQKNDAAFLLLAGKPVNIDIASIEERIRALHLEKDVMLKAEYVPFEQTAAYFFASDIVVFPYKEIDMSGALQLAYAFGKPVVCARSGGLPEAVAEGKNGVLVEPNDSEALAKSVVALLADEGRARQMGEESLRMAREDFSWQGIASSTVNVYQEVLRG